VQGRRWQYVPAQRPRPLRLSSKSAAVPTKGERRAGVGAHQATQASLIRYQSCRSSVRWEATSGCRLLLEPSPNGSAKCFEMSLAVQRWFCAAIEAGFGRKH